MVIPSAEGKIPHHLEIRQMRTVTDKIEIVGAKTRLKRAVPAPVGPEEALLHSLHPAADEQGRLVVRDNRAVPLQRESELVKSPADYV